MQHQRLLEWALSVQGTEAARDWGAGQAATDRSACCVANNGIVWKGCGYRPEPSSSALQGCGELWNWLLLAQLELRLVSKIVSVAGDALWTVHGVSAASLWGCMDYKHRSNSHCYFLLSRCI